MLVYIIMAVNSKWIKTKIRRCKCQNIKYWYKRFKKKIKKKLKVIFCVHVLGNSSNMLKIRAIAKKYNLILIEDTCESLGSSFNNKKLGTFGDFGTYSFYYSHQISSGEGGMVM